MEDDETITTKYLPRGLAGESRTGSEAGVDAAKSADRFRLPAEGVSLEEVEMSLVSQAIERSGGNQTKAAELLDISRDQLRYRLKKLEEASLAATDT